MTGHYKWASSVKATHLLAALQGTASDVLHRVPKEVTYKETIKALEDCFGDQHQATAYRSQLKMTTQYTGNSLPEFNTAIEQLAHRTNPALPEYHARREEFVHTFQLHSVSDKELPT
jgi:hypothetical protein